MNFADLWNQTMNNPDISIRLTSWGIFLQAIQTIFILVSGGFILVQLQQIKHEAIEKKITGLKTAREELNTELFVQASNNVASGRIVEGIKWRPLLDSINLVALLVEEGYTDPKLLLAMKGKALYRIGSYIQKNGLPKDLEDDTDDLYKPALKYLDDICKQAKKLGYLN